jgi:hypothetical protein
MTHGDPETGPNGSRSRATAIQTPFVEADIWGMDFGQVFAEIRRRAFARLKALDQIVETRLDERVIGVILAKSLPGR